MSTPLAGMTFMSRTDVMSYQVKCVEHPNFWFRLERVADHQDVVTDFLLTPRRAFPGDWDLTPLGGLLLRRCYVELGLQPPSCLVFGDILACQDPPDLSTALTRAQTEHAAWASTLFQAFGHTVSDSFLEKRSAEPGDWRHPSDKYDLIVNSTM